MPDNFEIEKIPFAQLEALSLSKADFLAMPSMVLNALLSGKRTPLLIFTQVMLQDGLVVKDMSARISLADTGADQYKIVVHSHLTKLPSSVLDLTLTKKEIDKLVHNEAPILAVHPKTHNTQHHCLVQYDKALNDLHIRPIAPSPDYINEHQLTSAEKKKFSLGEAIEIMPGTIRRDFNSPLGYRADFLVLPTEAIMGPPSALLDALTTTYIHVQGFYNSMMPPAGIRPGHIRYPSVLTAPDKGFLLEYVNNALRTIDKILKDPARVCEPKPIQGIRDRIAALATLPGLG